MDENKYFRSSATDKGLSEIFKLNFNITSSDRIIDIGCGKGRAINILLNFDFDHVDGIELSKYIAKTAKTNFIKLKKDKRVSIFSEDATIFKNYSKYTMFYLYNPFSCEIMEMFLKNLSEVFNNTDKDMFIIYRNPTCHKLFYKYNCFNLINKIDGENPWQTTYIYCNTNNKNNNA